jgi:TolB-like protein/tetratricopeptide (TPR) repeat protein
VALPTEPTAVPTGLTTRIVEQARAALADRYVVERELGRGGMALVFLARDVRDQRRVALKVIYPELASVVGCKRFQREIALARKLEHPHIVPVQDSGAVAGLLYYVMPYVEGESLRARLRRDGPLPLDEALAITRDVARALGYAHRRGIIHRDIKPENILHAGGGALVTDFGIAAAVGADGQAAAERLTDTGLALGTPAYMSPEQASGSRRLDSRADIYSLGCVLYEMLGGETPYTGPTPQAVIAKRLHEPVPQVRALREGLPAAVEQAVARALAKAPADRFATVEEFVAALAPDPTPGEALMSQSIHSTQTLRRRRVPWALAAASAAIVAGTAIALSLRRSPAAPVAASRAVSPDNRRVLVAVFANQTGDTALDPLGHIIADYLARGLAETRLAEVIDARAQASDSEVQPRGVTGARALARNVGARSVVWGSYARTGDSLRFQAQLTDASTGESLGKTTSIMESVQRPTEGVEVLRQRVMTELAATLDPRFAQFEGASRPARYDAYREYLAAQEMGVRGCPGRDCGADVIAGLRRAYALDSSFTLPLVTVAGAIWTRGNCLRTDSIVAVLHPRRDQLSSFERFSLDAAVARCQGKPLLALDFMRQGMAAAPRNDGLVLGFGWLARHHGFLREAIAVTEKLDRTRYEANAAGSTVGGTIRLYWGNLSVPYHLLGSHRQELEVERAERAAFPGDREAIWGEARALVGLGRLAEVDRRVAEILALPEELEISGGVPGWPETGGKSEALDDIGRDLRAHGHPAEARALFERALRYEYEIRRQSHAEPGGQVALLLYDLGRWNEALPIVKRLAAKYADDVGRWDIAAHWTLGAVYARLGDRRGVEKVDGWLARRGRRSEGASLNSSVHFERARLAAILGDRERAMTLLRRAVEEGAFLDEGHGLGPHSDPDFESLRDYPPFKKLTRPED